MKKSIYTFLLAALACSPAAFASPTKLVFLAQPAGSNAREILASQPQIGVVNEFGSLELSFSSTVSLSIVKNPSDGALVGNVNLIPTSGIAQFNGLSIDREGCGYALVAMSPSLVSAVSEPFDIGMNCGKDLQIISGDRQIAQPNRVFHEALVVKVLDAKGAPIPGVAVEFYQQSHTDATVLVESEITDDQGTSRSFVRAPSVNFTQEVVIVAKVRGANSQVQFRLNPSLVDHVRLNTTHGKIETAGVPFGFSIGVYDSKDNLMTGYTGTHATSWIVQTKTSVDGTAPSNLPTNFVCTFVNGICQLNSETVLVNPTTDSPVDRTLVSVGIDGDSVGAIYNDEIIVRDAE